MESKRSAEPLAEDDEFPLAVEHLLRGDFSFLEPLFTDESASHPCQVVQWLGAGRFRDAPDALREAFTCACFLGKAGVVQAFLGEGVDAEGGAATGMNALHWAVNRGQLETVQLLLETGVSLEVRNMYGGTALGAAIWAAFHESRPAHVAIIEALLKSGARVEAVDYPTGAETIDALLERYGAKRADAG
jgi:ankyrin repeat protein